MPVFKKLKTLFLPADNCARVIIGIEFDFGSEGIISLSLCFRDNKRTITHRTKLDITYIKET